MPQTLTALTALSPLDGRYAAKLAALRPLLSEFGLMHPSIASTSCALRPSARRALRINSESVLSI